MDFLRSDIIGARALNSSRKLHLPTYVALRFLLETVAGNKDSSWVSEVVGRKNLLQRKPEFYLSEKYKKMDAENNYIYREFVVPSPTGFLAESIALDYLSQSEEFKKNSRVYSHLWPSCSESPYNFEHYISGYRKRNEDIENYLLMNDGKVVLVTDIEKFYPSINQGIIKKRFSSKLESSSIPHEAKILVSKLAEDLFYTFPEGVGLATGPELSHVMGDIALEELDRVLGERYGEAYFRYVDDIVLVVDPHEKEDAITLLHELAGREFLTIHPDKTDLVSGEVWLQYGPHLQANVEDDSFEALLFRIKTFLKVNPDSEENLSRLLDSFGFSIPIGRLSMASKEGGFGSRLMGLLGVGWRVALKAVMSNEDDMLNQAKVVRKKINVELDALLSKDIPSGETLRKWHLQRLRYLTNRVVYLCSFDELTDLVPKLSPIPEFADTVALLAALTGSDNSELLSMPGAVSSACAGLLRHNGKRLKDIEITCESSSAEVESASIYSLWNVSNIKYRNIILDDNDVVEYLKFCSGVNDNKRDIDSFNYLDEIKSLATNKNREDILRVLESRLYEEEGAVLDALEIGWNSEY